MMKIWTIAGAFGALLIGTALATTACGGSEDGSGGGGNLGADGGEAGPGVDPSLDPDASADGSSPSLPTGLTAVALAAGGSSACAITGAGALRCWGTGTASSKEVAPGTLYERVTVAGPSGCAIRKADHAIDCWPSSTLEPTPRDTGTFKELASGPTHQCAIAQSGTLYCSGTNESGQLGTGANVPSTGFVAVGSETDWTFITTGGLHTCALKASGALFCWGDNNLGQIGVGGTSTQQPAPVAVAAGTTWLSVSAGSRATCGVTSTGSLRCWGLITSPYNVTPTDIDTAADWARASVGTSHACGLKQDGRLYCWGTNSDGQLGSGTLNASPSPVQVGTDKDWADVVTGADFTCGTKKNSQVYCWGSNAAGQLGLGNVNHLAPTKIGAGADWKDVGANGSTTCAVKKSGELACWGIVPGGTVGPQQAPLTIGTETSWATVRVGSSFACATKTDQSLHCWGYGNSGQLGIGATTSAPLPTSVGLAAKSYSLGDNHVCALRASDSLLFCWGSSQFGKTLHADSTTPLQSGAEAWNAIAASSTASCGIRATGALFCFGLGYTNQEQLGADTTWTAVTGGTGNGFLGIRGGQIQTWAFSTALAPKGAETTWRSVVVGGSHECAIRTDNTLACSGGNSFGQIGNGTTAAQPTPANVGTSADWQTVATGGTHTCGLRNDGELYCWGNNDLGQIGDGSAWSTTPVPVP
jgi:alpha-tubulin suppressor-like RCC1 family protein